MSATFVETAISPSTVSHWARYPSIYEINTWVWLSELSEKYGRKIDLSSVPNSEWDAIAAFGFDAVWLMGVWERSPMGVGIANRNPELTNGFRQVLPDFKTEDNVGSPYCIRSYVVDAHLGGTSGLAHARQELSKRGINLVLDFVANHVAPDHPWVTQHPEFFIHATANDASSDPNAYIQLEGSLYACGRDPYFPAWPDVLQLNAFEPGLRKTAIETVLNIAEQCDGIRCDMAMLLLNPVFERTWGHRIERRSGTEFWADLITAVKNEYPGFLFIAEAYWDLEWQLQQLGFDFCYDKKLYDQIEHGNAESIQSHLSGDLSYQSKLLRFIENHDEPRAAATLSCDKERAAALIMNSVPGIRLFHEGQFEGRKARASVFLRRRAQEPVDHFLQEFYTKLLTSTNRPAFREGEWKPCTRSGWPDNASFHNLVAWSWQQDGERFLCVVNFSPYPSQARVQVPWSGVRDRSLQLIDVFSGNSYERAGNEMLDPGLYVALEPWSYHFLECLQ